MEVIDYRSITRYGIYDYITEEGALKIELAMKYFDDFKNEINVAKMFKKDNDAPKYVHRHLAIARQSYKSYCECMKKIHQLFGKDINWRIDWYKAHGEIPTAKYLYNLPVSKEDTEAWLNR